MNALAHRLGTFFGMTWDKPRQEPEPFCANPRPMSGLFGSLTSEQKAKALAYRGAEEHGDQDLLKAR